MNLVILILCVFVKIGSILGHVGSRIVQLILTWLGWPFWWNVVNKEDNNNSTSNDKEDYYEWNVPKPRSMEPLVYVLSSLTKHGHKSGRWTTASDGRRVRFRGINLPAKTPSSPADQTDTRTAWAQLLSTSSSSLLSKQKVSFVGRPFPLNVAREQFRRLSAYGFNLLRLSVTWEAVMHEGPGQVDGAYLRYLSQLVDLAAEYGLYVLIDPHQDVWSRFTGGDGAPLWTLDVAGFRTDDDRLYHESGCAHVHGVRDETTKGDKETRVLTEEPSKEPPMLWTTNYARTMTCTMFTLFFAGKTYTPNFTVVEGAGGDEDHKVNIQDYLQGHYLRFLEVVAQALRHKVNVLGFEGMNEPSNGYVGLKDLNLPLMVAPLGHPYTAFEGMRLARGESLRVGYFPAPFFFDQWVTLNRRGESLWKSPDHDPWAREGIYDVEETTTQRRERLVLKRPHHFRATRPFHEAHLAPFYERVRETVVRCNPRFVVYVEPHVDLRGSHDVHEGTDATASFARAPHFYDVLTLVTKRYRSWIALDFHSFTPVFTSWFVRRCFRRVLRRMAASSDHHVVLGEVGVPFDLLHHEGWGQDPAEAAMERTLSAVEAADLDYTLWNYTYDNNGTLAEGGSGDLWNGEDLSIRVGASPSTSTGGTCPTNPRNRALSSVIRPYVFKYGVSEVRDVVQSFDHQRKEYRLRFRWVDPSVSPKGANEIFVPTYHFRNPLFEVSSGTIQYDKYSQTATWNGLDQNQDTHFVMIIDE